MTHIYVFFSNIMGGVEIKTLQMHPVILSSAKDFSVQLPSKANA